LRERLLAEEGRGAAAAVVVVEVIASTKENKVAFF
jgi:hypothetical protein